jgi:hypothetical protein
LLLLGCPAFRVYARLRLWPESRVLLAEALEVGNTADALSRIVDAVKLERS